MISSLNIDNPMTQDSLLTNRLKSLSQFEIGDKTELSPEQKAKAAEAAKGFESMFLNMMLKEMKSAMLDEFKEKEESDAFGADTLESYTDMLLSDSLSKQGSGLGIAEMIYKKLTGGANLERPIVEKFGDNPLSNKISAISEAAAETEESKSSVTTGETASGINEQIKKLVDDRLSKNFGGNFMERVEGRLSQFNGIIEKASEKFGVPAELIKSIITAESAGRPEAQSGAGAKGLMQLMDGTAKDMGVRDSFDPNQNIFGGTKYIKKMLDSFGNDVELALAAYNAGPGNVRKYDGIPPFKETEAYVKKVKNYLAHYSE